MGLMYIHFHFADKIFGEKISLVGHVWMRRLLNVKLIPLRVQLHFQFEIQPLVFFCL